MAKDRKKLLHIHSSIPDKQPTAASLEVGEIAVNNAANQEFISLKNSNNKVVRLSSDEQIVTIMEKKEVMPYDGYVRGETGPSGTKDGYGSYGITENDLLSNTSNIVIKLNQVAAGNTVKHDEVNGAKDRYNKCVNPTSDSGLTDGAGFYIDMSRYAMQGANPTFSGITNTCYTELNGRTEILGGSGTAGSCRSLLNIDVLSATTNVSSAWTTGGTADTTINSAKTDIETALTEITSANTTIGTDILHVSGTTTETHDGAVTITNNNNKTETTKGNVETNVSGTTSENYKEAVTINNLSTKAETTTGVNEVNNKSDYNVNTTGNTNFNSTGDTNIHADANICETADVNATFYGAAKTNVGLNCNDNASATTTNVYGGTLNTSASTANTTIGTANTTVTSANTNITSATTTIGTASTTITDATTNISTATTTVTAATTTISTATTNITLANTTATTANYNGTTLNSNINNVTHSGQTLNVTENTTDITSCGHLYLNTNDFKLEQCSGSQGSASLKFCSGFTVDSNKFTLEECTAGSGSILIKETTSEISGTNLTINEGDDVTINAGDDFAVNTSGDTTITTTGQTQITSTQNVCVTSKADANFGGDANTRIGADCNGTTGYSNNTYITASSSAFTYAPNVVNSGTTNENTFTTINNSATTENNNITNINNTATTENNNIATINTTATTINTSATTINQSGSTYNVTANTETHNTTAFTVNSTSAACIVSDNTAGIGGDITTNVGANCQGGAISNTTNIYGDTLVESGTTNNNTFTTINNSATTINSSATTINNTATTENNNITTINNNTTTYNITGETNIEGDTNITGDTYIDGDLTVTGEICPTNGLCKTLTWTYGSVCNEASGSTNFKDNESFVIPKTIADVTCNVVDLTENCLSINKNVCVSGTVTSSQGMYTASDERLKENISFIGGYDLSRIGKIQLKSFNYKADKSNRKVYGVIAQDLQNLGFDNLVYTDEEGMLAVDYTGFLLLKIAQLEKQISLLNVKLDKLENKE